MIDIGVAIATGKVCGVFCMALCASFGVPVAALYLANLWL